MKDTVTKRKPLKFALLLFAAVLLCVLVAFVYRAEHESRLGLALIAPPQAAWALAPPQESVLALGGALLPQNEGVYTIPQSLAKPAWEGRLECTLAGSHLYWQADPAFDDKAGAIAGEHLFTFWLKQGQEWSALQVVFTGLPLMTLESSGSTLETENGQTTEVFTGNLALFDPDGEKGRYTVQTTPLTYHVRGAKSATHYEKVGYKLNLKDGRGSKRDLAFLDMPADDDWILRCLYTDPLKVREQVASDLWNDLARQNPEDPPCSDTRFLELYLEGEYYGLMGLMQRTDGKTLALGEEDILYKNTAPELATLDWESAAEDTILYHVPTAPAGQAGVEVTAYHEGSTAEGTRKVRLIQCPAALMGTGTEWQPLQQLWQQLYGEGAPADYDTLSKNYSVSNLIDFALYKQVCYAVDNELNNMFFWAKKEGEGYRLYYLPWDVDYTFGSVGAEDEPNLSRFKEEGAEVLADNALLESLLAADEETVIPLVQERWAQLRQGLFSLEDLQARFAAVQGPLLQSGAFQRDSRRWPNEKNDMDLSALNSYLARRMNFLDSYVNGLGQEW